MPSANERMAAPANTGLKRSSRAPNRKSLQRVSMCVSQLAERTFSFTASTPPISSRAARCASSRVIPPRIFSAVDFSRKSRSSSSSSCSALRLPKSPRIPRQRFVHISFIPCRGGLAPPSDPPPLTCRLQDPRNGRDLPLPLFGFRPQLLPPGFCERVVFRPPVIFRSPPFTFEQPRALQPSERREKGTWVNFEHAAA